MENATRRNRRTSGVKLRLPGRNTTDTPLESAPLPGELIIPLEAGLSVRDIRPAVQSGDRVLRGQPLVEGGGPLTLWTHASTSGIVRTLESRPIIHPRRDNALCAVVEVDGEDEEWHALAPPDPTQWDTPEKLSAAMSHAGIAGLGGAVFPTGVKLAAAWRRPIREVLINAAECEPYITCDEMLMQTSPREVLAGAMALIELTGAERGFVILEQNMPAALAALEREMPLFGSQQKLELVTVPAIYPAGGERQLIQALTGHEVPSLAHPTDIGYLCQNVGTVVSLFHFLQSGRPVTSRITTVTGDAIAHPRNLEVRLGTPISHLIEVCGGYTAPVSQLIMGGAMMGIALDNDSIPITRAANCIIAATDSEFHGEVDDEMPCIRCSECASVCPSYLLPQELHRATRHDDFNALEDLGLFDCIECGCCDVVCPSHIRLTESFRDGKHRLLQAMDIDARVRWLDAREQRRLDHVQAWTNAHDPEAANEQSPKEVRLEAVSEVIDRVRGAPESIDG